MKKSLLCLSACIILVAGCGNGQDEAASSISGTHDSETVVNTADSSVENGTTENMSVDSTEAVPDHAADAESSASENETADTESPSYLEKMQVYFDENGKLILDNGGFCYPFILNTGSTDINISNPELVIGKAYEEIINYEKATCYPIELSAEPENILLGTLAKGIYFYPNNEYFDENYLRDRVSESGIYGYVDSISKESVSVFTGEENWLYGDTYLELVNVSDTAIDMPLAEDVQFALLDRNFLCTKVTEARFRQKIDKYEQEEKPAGSIFILYLEDGRVVQIIEHYNP
ncbi:MAG: hypothetical protein K2O34_09205 [Acetatifactor sp.]|nr:hypothetical protein [Acetatifactor sp.]